MVEQLKGKAVTLREPFGKAQDKPQGDGMDLMKSVPP